MNRVTDTQTQPNEASGCILLRLRSWKARKAEIAVMLMGFISIEGLTNYAKSLINEVDIYSLKEIIEIGAMIDKRREQIETLTKK
jgi:CRISPR/Cas system CMR-associated protein Cmr3 (group 5 of RAMP superfamily)